MGAGAGVKVVGAGEGAGPERCREGYRGRRG